MIGALFSLEKICEVRISSSSSLFKPSASVAAQQKSRRVRNSRFLRLGVKIVTNVDHK